MITEKYDFNFEKRHKFSIHLQDVLSDYKENSDREMCVTKSSSILLYFKSYYKHSIIANCNRL